MKEKCKNRIKLVEFKEGVPLKRYEIYDYNTIFNLYITQNLNFKDIQKILGISEAKLRNMLEYHDIKKDYSEIINKRKQTNLKKYGTTIALKNPEIKEKAEKTLLKKYGVDNAFKSKEIQEKIKQTNLEKYGTENPFASDIIKEKIKQTNLEKYGNESAMRNEEVKTKLALTNLEKYGSISAFGNKDIREKSNKTKIEKYGTTNTSSLQEIKLKTKQNNTEKYGVEHPMLLDKVKEKIKQTHIEKYGDYFHRAHLTNKEKLNEEFTRNNFIKNNRFEIKKFAEYFNFNNLTARKYKNQYNITEPNKKEKHAMQSFIFDKIQTTNKIEDTRQIIKPLELDIYLPDIKLGIEYDGLMFHSFGLSDKAMFNNVEELDPNIHLRKTEICESEGIHLFHIFEGEPVDLWLSMIHNKLGLNTKLFARKCFVKEIRYKDTIDFLNQNHLQGSTVAKVNLGLFFTPKTKEEINLFKNINTLTILNDSEDFNTSKSYLVSLMTFSVPRFNKNYEYELIRFCSLKNFNIIGAASKLFCYFKKNYNPKNIITYANRRFSNGHLYRTLGFNQTGISNPNYFYFKWPDTTLYPRVKFQKHKLEKQLEFFDPDLTEAQNMFLNGYRRIYDCGNLVYEYRNIKS